MTYREVAAVGGLALALVLGAAKAQASCSFRGLNGTWQSDDGGTYQVTESGNRVSWTGKSPENGRWWAHRFQGTRSGNVIRGKWADYRGPMGSGTLTLQFRNVMNFHRTGATGSDFGGTRWWRGCNDVVLQPVDE